MYKDVEKNITSTSQQFRQFLLAPEEIGVNIHIECVRV